MRTLVTAAILYLFAGLAFGQTTSTTSVDIASEKAALNELMDKIYAEFIEGHATTFKSSLSEDALFCGTDPSEFWNTKEFLALNNQDSSDPDPDFKFFGERRIKVLPDGNSAILVSQFFTGWSPKIPCRQVFHFYKIDGSWKICFMNIAFVPINEDIGKINKAIE